MGSFKGGAVAGAIPKCNLSIVDDDSAKGEKGDKGDIGLPGIQGIQGIQGEKGDKGEAGAGLKWKGNWVYGNYEVGDLVNYLEDVYICVSKPIINYPIGLTDYYGYEDYSIFPGSSNDWEIFCRRGMQGVAGEPGKSLLWKGEYNINAVYNLLDAVTYLGSSWYCRIATSRTIPGQGTDWVLLVQGGTITWNSWVSVNYPQGITCWKIRESAKGFVHLKGSKLLTVPVGQSNFSCGDIPPAFETTENKYFHAIAISDSGIGLVIPAIYKLDIRLIIPVQLQGIPVTYHIDQIIPIDAGAAILLGGV